MERRDFLRVTGLGIGAAVAGCTAARTVDIERVPATQASTQAAAGTQPSEPARIRTGPYLQDPGEDAMTVMWMTNVAGYGYVEFGTTEALGEVASADVDGLTLANTMLHKVRLTGLKAGARYFYRVVFRATPTFRSHKIVLEEPIHSETRSFVTRDGGAKGVRFVMYNDLHDNVAMWRTLHGYVKSERFDFAFLNGDVTNTMQDEKQMVDCFLDPVTEHFSGSLPFLYARGNHETRGGYSREMKKYLGMPGDSYHYAFSQGGARFVVLDTGEDKEDQHPDYFGLCNFDAYRSMQREFLEREIASDAWKSARWRIAMFHIPGLYSKDVHSSIEVREKFHKLLAAGKADLFLAGHTHRYTIAAADPSKGHAYPVVIGGGPKTGKGTVTTVDVGTENIRVKQVRDDGQAVGELTV